MSAGLVNSQEKFCENIVRQFDLDRYRLVLSQKASKRANLWPLLAFNHEIAKTAEVVSEPTLGLIRLQWWRDAFENIYAGGAVPAHEILQALAPVIAAYDLPQEKFIALIDAREFDLAKEPASDLSALVDYAHRTTTPLNELVLQVLGQFAEKDAVKNISTAYALTGLLRAAPFRAARNLPLFLPHGVSAAEILAAAQENLIGKNPNGYLKASKALTEFYIYHLKKLNYEVRNPQSIPSSIGFAIKALLHSFC